MKTKAPFTTWLLPCKNRKVNTGNIRNRADLPFFRIEKLL